MELFLPIIMMFTDQHILLGFGSTYYLRPDEPSWFFEGGLGGSSVSDPYEKAVSAFPNGIQDGLGAFGGVGYEFARRFRTEIQLTYGRSREDDQGMERSWSATSLMVTITYSGY